MRTTIFAATVLATLLGPNAWAAAQDSDSVSVSVPADSKFLVHVDIGAFRKTSVGARLFEMAKREALKEIGDDDGNDFEELKETLGFDPFKELDAITIVGTDFGKPEDHTHVVLRMRETTGNLKSLMATLPDHDSSEYGDHTIHSASPNETRRMFGAIHTDDQRIKRVVAARTQKAVRNLLDMLDGKTRKPSKAVKLSRTEGQFVQIELLDIPRENVGRGAPVNIAELVQGLSLKVGNDDENLAITVAITTKKEQQAKQVRQMVQGMTAMIQLVDDAGEGEGEEDDEDEGAGGRWARDVLEKLKVTRKGSVVRIRLTLPEADLVEWIEQEMSDI